MAPEQAKGLATDKRGDVWAFGCVLYEMLAGKRAFAGEDISDTLAAVLRDEPDWFGLPDRLPLSVRQLLGHCLDKELKNRLRDMHAARLQIEEALRDPASGPTEDDPRTAPADAAPSGPVGLLTLAVGIVAAVGGVAATIMTVGRFENRSAENDVLASHEHLSVSAQRPAASEWRRRDLTEGRPSRTAMVLSPDGRSLVFSAVRGSTQQLFRRELDQLEAVPIVGTEGGASPFFSPDGRWVGFWADNGLKKVPLTVGSGAVAICETRRIVGRPGAPTTRSCLRNKLEGCGRWQALGGQPRQPHPRWTRRRTKSVTGCHTCFREATLYYSRSPQTAFPKWEETHVWVQSLRTGERKELVQGADARYIPTGHLVYVHAGDLLAVPFDPRRLEVTGGPVNMIPQLLQAAYTPTPTTIPAPANSTCHLPAHSSMSQEECLLTWNVRSYGSIGRAQPNRSLPRRAPTMPLDCRPTVNGCWCGLQAETATCGSTMSDEAR